MWGKRDLDQRRMTDGRVSSRAVGLHERAEEILAPADYSGTRLTGQSNSPHPGVGRGAVYLHIVLGSSVSHAEQEVTLGDPAGNTR